MMNKLVSKSLISTGLVIALASVNAYGQEQMKDTPPDWEPTSQECDGFEITPNEGWKICILETAGDVDTFTIPAGQEGCLRVTDSFLPGNTFTVVHENGNKGSEGFNAGGSLPSPVGDPAGNLGWFSDDHFSARAGLSNKGHTVTVTDTFHLFGASAYYVRFDTDMVCTPLKAKDLVSTPAIIITNTGKDYEDVVAPDGSVAATNVAPGISVVIPMPAE